jgi:DNA-binding NtrC family response regulator
VVEIALPPLRERREDLPALTQRLLAQLAERYGRGPKGLTPAAAAALARHAWPGNVRELRNALARSSLMARGGVILPEHLPPRVQRSGPATQPQESTAAGDSREAVQTLAAGEKQRILSALAHCSGNRTRAAQMLGIGRRTLIYRLKTYASDDRPPDEPPAG